MTTDVSQVPFRRERSDVVRNRTLLVTTADKLIAERGLDISFHDLAGAAGVGVGTVYRHFTDKEALLGALIDRRFEQAMNVLLQAETHPDPVRALREAVHGICALQETDRGVLQVILSGSLRGRLRADEVLLPISRRIVDRALATGRVRPDFSASDLPLIFRMVSALSLHSGAVRTDIWRRYVDAMLDGFMLEGSDRAGPAVAAPSPEETHRFVESTAR